MRPLSQAKIWSGRICLVTMAVAVLVVPRLITAAPLDLLEGASTPYDPAEDPAANFPGSAFFFADGAFDPVPGARTVQGSHVLGLDTVTAAPATVFRGITTLDSYRALNCLTAAIYYEAGNEPDEGQRAVAQVVLNRVRSASWPNSICGVVYEGSERADDKCQFTFSCDGAMTRTPAAAPWVRARLVAQRALAGDVYRPVGLATYYHTLAVRPAWSAIQHPVAVVGAHIFYRQPGFNGTPASFTIAYSGHESISGPAPRLWTALPVAPAETPTAPYGGGLAVPSAVGSTSRIAPVNRDDNLPESTIRPEYRNSGRPLT